MARQDYETLGLSVPVTEALDPQLWRERYAWGLVLGPSADRKARQATREFKRLTEAIPNEVIRWHIRCALSEIELKIGLPLGVEICKADPVDAGLRLGHDYDRQVVRLPYTHGEMAKWFRIDIPWTGVISVERIRAYYFGSLIWELSTANDNASNIRLQWGTQGIVHILPVQLNALAVVGADGSYGPWHTLVLHHTPVPDFWAVDFTRGPVSAHGQKPGEIEAALVHYAHCIAGILLLSEAGMAQSRGLSNTSISLDGVSRSVGLTASAIYGLNSALESAYEKAAKRIDIKAIRRAKRGLRMKMMAR